ncbi:hypothetical protein DIURU_002475 [Diutina rugosa]|uniref:Ribosome-recycling factor, mitochondrial n=1 Tax=Diutina rugosa TaxID=5481 RepID=A0A642UQ17_DIURU|nr:uncharacterized protein DIURU_002475 [Diutina rugosa]KAA8903313.1 hypothetical protein DIURU_002475 [Diutina rugosa]
MFKLALSTVRLPVVTRYAPLRTFYASPVMLKAKKGGKKAAAPAEDTTEAAAEGPLIDIPDVTKKFQQVVEKFGKAANDAKLGKSNPKIFDKLVVETGDGEMPFTSVAQTSVKGRNFIITLFDPANAKHVINTVLGSGLNLNAQVDPTNKYTLKVPLPPVSTETKKEAVKQLKEQFEKFKSGKTGLAGIRADTKSKFQKKCKSKKPSDAEQKELDAFEKVHKTFNDKLAEAFKQAETAIMK